MPSFAAIALPLSDLTKKGLPKSVRWEEKAFVTLRESLVRRPIMRLPGHNKTFILRTDTSNCGLGAALMKKHEGRFFSNRVRRQEADICRAEVFHHREGVFGYCVGSIEISSVSGW